MEMEMEREREREMESSWSCKRAKGGGETGAGDCLVDGCDADLRECREYHRRHKVCEGHSKSPKVSIGGREQRFCQQCSRFHSLVEFDEGKRSCRKRLDGHNRRRRKPQQQQQQQPASAAAAGGGTLLVSFNNNNNNSSDHYDNYLYTTTQRSTTNSSSTSFHLQNDAALSLLSLEVEASPPNHLHYFYYPPHDPSASAAPRSFTWDH